MSEPSPKEARLTELRGVRAALAAALSRGVKRFNFYDGGTRRETEFHSLPEMQDALDRLDRDIAQMEGVRPHTFRPYFGKGL